MWLLGLILVLLCGCASQPVYLDLSAPVPAPAPDRNWHRTRTPKATLASFDMSPSSVQPVEEDSVTHIPFQWNYPNAVQTFRLYIGKQSRMYTEVIDIGENTFYDLWKTNWTEELDRHWFAITAVDPLGRESDYSNEVFYPPYPPDRFVVTWLNPEPATLLTSTNQSTPWLVINRSEMGTRAFFDMIRYPMQVFKLVRSNGVPDMLNITAFNPLNSQ